MDHQSSRNPIPDSDDEAFEFAEFTAALVSGDGSHERIRATYQAFPQLVRMMDAVEQLRAIVVEEAT